MEKSYIKPCRRHKVFDTFLAIRVIYVAIFVTPSENNSNKEKSLLLCDTQTLRQSFRYFGNVLLIYRKVITRFIKIHNMLNER